MYASGNPKTKKMLKQWIAEGKQVSAFQAGGLFEGKTQGEVTIEGPHYPQAHSWYARVRLAEGLIVKVLS